MILCQVESALGDADLLISGISSSPSPLHLRHSHHHFQTPVSHRARNNVSPGSGGGSGGALATKNANLTFLATCGPSVRQHIVGLEGSLGEYHYVFVSQGEQRALDLASFFLHQLYTSINSLSAYIPSSLAAVSDTTLSSSRLFASRKQPGSPALSSSTASIGTEPSSSTTTTTTVPTSTAKYPSSPMSGSPISVYLEWSFSCLLIFLHYLYTRHLRIYFGFVYRTLKHSSDTDSLLQAAGGHQASSSDGHYRHSKFEEKKLIECIEKLRRIASMIEVVWHGQISGNITEMKQHVITDDTGGWYLASTPTSPFALPSSPQGGGSLGLVIQNRGTPRLTRSSFFEPASPLDTTPGSTHGSVRC